MENIVKIEINYVGGKSLIYPCITAKDVPGYYVETYDNEFERVFREFLYAGELINFLKMKLETINFRNYDEVQSNLQAVSGDCDNPESGSNR